MSTVVWITQLIRGVGVAGLASAGVLAAGLILGVVDGTSLLLFPVAAIVGALTQLIPNSDRRAQLAGAALVGIASLGSALATGLGWAEISGMAGAVIAIVFVGSHLNWRVDLPLFWVAVLAVAVAAMNLIPLVLDGGGLGHDESAYALKALHWLEGTPETGWGIHRGIAMSGYGYLVLGAGGSEVGLRLLGLAGLMLLAAATWVLGSHVGGRWVGPVSAVALVSSPAILRRSTEFLSDVPSAALLVACMIVIWVEFSERKIPTYRLLWLLPFAWMAFYIRYQSLLSFVLISVTMAILFWKKVVKGWRPVVLTAVLGFVGLIPHFLFAISRTGSPLGIIFYTAEVAGRQYYGEGLVDYFMLMGWPLAAFIGPVAVGFFVWWLVSGWRSGTERMRSLFLAVPAVGQVLILGISSHGEARFIFFPLSLILIGGITGLGYVMRRWRPGATRAATVGLIVLLVGSFAESAADVRRSVADRSLGTETVELASAEIRAMSHGHTCGVMTSYLPQITYYSECFTSPYRVQLEPDDALSLVSGEERFMLLIEDGKRQPEGEELSKLVDLTTGQVVRIDGEGKDAEIYVFGE